MTDAGRQRPREPQLPDRVNEWRREHVSAVLPTDITELHFDHIESDVPIIGLTGALGSGCTFFGEGLAKFHGYLHCRLSDAIHELAKRSGLDEHSFGVLQDIGNRLRSLFGYDVLVRIALSRADAKWGDPSAGGSRPSGIALDGIRNLGELHALRQLPNFFLVSIQAEQDTREERLIKAGRCASTQDFAAANGRDQEERGAYGQQIKLCNYHADIVILNNRNVARDVDTEFEHHVHDLLYDKYVRHIELLAVGKQDVGYLPEPREALMTAAYVVSKRSSCLKRKVGAVIATREGEVISSGYNEVPQGSESCLRDTRYNQCARDQLQVQLARKLQYCPACGKKITVSSACASCGEELHQFAKQCPKCGQDPDVEYTCDCGISVFREFLSGMSGETGRLLDMCRALHAEENAILNLTKTGALIPPGSVLYTTTFPCNLCANKIVTANISKVVFCEPYVTREAVAILERAGLDGEKSVEVEPFQGVKSSAFFKLFR